MDKQIKCYRDLSKEEVVLLNEAKTLADSCSTLINKLKALEGPNQRWVSIGAIDLQKGFMGLIRGIEQPTTF